MIESWINIFPNPTSGIVCMHKADFIISEIFVYSIAGKEVFHNNPKNNAGNTCINLSDLPPGFYVIKITENSDKSYTVPLVLK
ncbi:MAG: T9SS type A sorting domain-containing protein [Bacteroidales bacterium]